MFKLIKKLVNYSIVLVFIGFIGMGAWSFVDSAGYEAYNLEQEQKRQAEVQAKLEAEQEAQRIHAEKMQDPKYAFVYTANKLDNKACSYTRSYIRENVKSRKSLDWNGWCKDWAVFYTDGTPDSAGYIKIIQKFSATNSFGAVIDNAVEGIFIVNVKDNSLKLKSFTLL